MEYGSVKSREAAAVGLNIGTTAATAAGATLAAGAKGTASAGVVVKMLALAGVEASAGPVGWVLAAGTVIAAGIISLVGHAKRKTLMTSQVVELANMYGVPQIASDPAWVIDAINWGYHQRKLEGERIESKLAKGKGKEWELRTKLSFLGVLELNDLMDRRRAAGLRPIPVSEAEIQAMLGRAASEQSAIQAAYRNRKVGLAAIGAGVVVAAIVIRRRRS